MDRRTRRTTTATVQASAATGGTWRSAPNTRWWLLIPTPPWTSTCKIAMRTRTGSSTSLARSPPNWSRAPLLAAAPDSSGQPLPSAATGSTSPSRRSRAPWYPTIPTTPPTCSSGHVPRTPCGACRSPRLARNCRMRPARRSTSASRAGSSCSFRRTRASAPPRAHRCGTPTCTIATPTATRCSTSLARFPHSRCRVPTTSCPSRTRCSARSRTAAHSRVVPTACSLLVSAT